MSEMACSNNNYKIPFYYKLLSGIKKLLPCLYKSVFSIFIFLCLCITVIYFPSIKGEVEKYTNVDNLFFAFGGVLAAILTLTISLAVIPIQRGIEIFSPTIRRNYLNDLYIQMILIILGLFVFISFSLPFINITVLSKIN